MRHVKVVNRTKQDLTGVYDSRQVTIPPGEHTFPWYEAEKYRDQNPVMGTEDPDTGDAEYKLAIPELGDDTSPLPDDLKEANERLDRSKIYQPEGTVRETVEIKGLYVDRGAVPNNSALSADTQFENDKPAG